MPITNNIATGKTLEEIDALFARSPEVRARLEREIEERRGRPESAETLDNTSVKDIGTEKPNITYKEKV